MPLPSDETIRTAALDAFVEAIHVERDPWRQARLLAFVRKQRDHGPLREVAAELFEKEKHAPVSERRCYWATLEILTEPSERPPAEGPLWIEPVSDVCLVRIAPGSFLMGSKKYYSDPMNRFGADQPLHEVEITREYWLGRHAVTNCEYRRYLDKDFAAAVWKNQLFNGNGQPMIGVSWNEAELGYCGWLRERTGLAFHLPSEAEWEYGCRVGSETDFFFGDDEAELENYGWYGEKWETGSSHTVGLKRSNAWGLCDMHGNVWEWCWDRQEDSRDWQATSYLNGFALDPIGTPTGRSRSGRGGAWLLSALQCRAGHRSGFVPSAGDFHVGFRLALSPVRRPEAG